MVFAGFLPIVSCWMVRLIFGLLCALKKCVVFFQVETWTIHFTRLRLLCFRKQGVKPPVCSSLLWFGLLDQALQETIRGKGRFSKLKTMEE